MFFSLLVTNVVCKHSFLLYDSMSSMLGRRMFSFVNSLYWSVWFFNYYEKWLCIKEKLGLDHFKVLEQFGIQNCLLLNKYNHTQFIQLPFFSFIYWGLDNKTDIIGRILKFTMETEAVVEGKRMYFWILLKLLDLAVSTRSVLEKEATKWYPNYCLKGQRQLKTTYRTQ